MSSIINDIQVGQDTKIEVSSRSHGRKRIPMAQTLGFTPAKTVTQVGEFDNKNPILTFETFDGVEVSFEVMQADQADLEAMVMDQNPAGNIVAMDQSQTGEVRIWCNYTGRNTGYVYAAEFAEDLRLSANPSTSTLKDPTKQAYTFKGTRYVRVKGKTGQKCSIQYNRFVNTPTYATADDINFAGSVGTFPKTPVDIPQYGGVTYTDNLAVVKNGTKLTTGFTIDKSGKTITMTDAPASGDVVETWTVSQE
jgi:hypothetical protein